MPSSDRIPHVVVVGGGFAGLWATRALARDPVRITLVDRGNHHLFQPLLYQVATAGLSAPDIAAPLRHILRSQDNVEVRLAEVQGIDTAAKTLALADGTALAFDTLVLAWWFWLIAHVFFLIGFRNRLVVLLNWTWAYWSYQRAARIIFGPPVDIAHAPRPEDGGPDTPRIG